MGSLLVFRCDACGYETQVSGGRDRGMIVEVQTVTCEQCKALHDAVVRKWDRSEMDKTARRRKLRCPKDRRHRVEPWTPGGPCPRCGTPITEGIPYAIWD